MNFSAAILCGGKSSRMGSDKAFTELGGQTLLARQIQLVRAVGASEILISGRSDTNYPATNCRVLTDIFLDAGPLAGIHSALAAATTPLVLVLAVDMPVMSADILRQLIASCRANAGVVPRVAGEVEPLAAIYPKTAISLAAELLEKKVRPVKKFSAACEHAGLITYIDLQPEAANHFDSCNSPADLESLRSK